MPLLGTIFFQNQLFLDVWQIKVGTSGVWIGLGLNPKGIQNGPNPFCRRMPTAMKKANSRRSMWYSPWATWVYVWLVKKATKLSTLSREKAHVQHQRVQPSPSQALWGEGDRLATVSAQLAPSSVWVKSFISACMVTNKLTRFSYTRAREESQEKYCTA